MTSITPLNSHTHRNLCIDIGQPFARAKRQHLLPVYAGEFVLASGEFPIVFVKDKETGQISSAVLTGLKPKQNLFFGDHGWTADYAPLSIHALPIALVADANDAEKLIAVINEDSRYVSESDGERLFDDNGEQTEFLNTQTQLASDKHVHAQQTEHFIKKLLDLNVIVSNPITVQPEGESAYELQGLYVIDEAKMNELSDEQYLELRQLGYLPAIYAAITSKHRLNSLLRKQASIA